MGANKFGKGGKGIWGAGLDSLSPVCLKALKPERGGGATPPHSLELLYLPLQACQPPIPLGLEAPPLISREKNHLGWIRFVCQITCKEDNQNKGKHRFNIGESIIPNRLSAPGLEVVKW